MTVANSGTNVLVNNTGINIAGFTNAAASNIKAIDNIYQITSKAAGGVTNGTILLSKASGAVANLKTTRVFQTQAYPQVDVGSSSDSPISNMYIDFSDATLLCTGISIVSEIVAPMKLNERSKVVWSGGSWNSIHPGVQIDGATIIFTGATDCHLGYNPAGYVRNAKITCVGTSDADIVMALQPIWSGNTNNDKPVPMDGLVLTSVSGNTKLMPFSWSGGTVPWGQPNNAFMIYRDFGYNVGNGNAPSSIKRSYRRNSYTGNASCVYGTVSLNLAYLWVDAYTNLNASGVVTSNKTYLKQADYNTSGTAGGDTNVDIFAFRFSPKFVDASETLQTGISVAVINGNVNATSSTIGDFRCKISASGTTGPDGKIIITEPTTKDYTTSTSYKTDSICFKNRASVRYHKFWESGTKYIIVGDSSGSTGTTFGDVYSNSDYTGYYRKPGYVFVVEPLTMTGPITNTNTMSSDKSYNSSSSTTNISVSYSATVTTVNLGANTYTADAIYKAIIDFHSTIANTESVTTVPVDQNTGTLKYTNKLVITSVAGTVVNSGVNVTSIETTFAFSSLGTWNLNITDANGGTKKINGISNTYVEIKDNLNNTIIAYAKQTGSIYFRTINGRTYTLLVRRMGYQSYTTTLDGNSGTFTVTQNRDKVLWPLDSTKSVSDLRTDALAITGYTLNANGSVIFKNSGNLKDAYMSFSYQEELDSNKISPTYDGTTMTTLSDSSMNDINGLPLIGNGNIVAGGLWNGDIDDVGVTDSNGVRIVIKEDNGILSNVGTLHNYELSGQEEKYVTNKSKHILTVVKGHTFRFCIGAKGYITQFRNLNIVDKPQKITVILSIDSNIDSNVDLTPWNDAVSLHTLDTTNNSLAILFKSGTIQPALGQAGLADLTNKEQYMRLANRLSDSLLMYTTSSGAKLKGQNITLLTAPGVGDYDNVELLTYVEGPDNFVINPKVSTQTFAGPDKSQVVVTKVRPQIAKVETEQMASIAILARDYIERDAGLLKKIVNPKITKN